MASSLSGSSSSSDMVSDRWAAGRDFAEYYFARERNGQFNSRTPLSTLFQIYTANVLSSVSFEDKAFFPSMALAHTMDGAHPLRDLFSLFLKFIPKEVSQFSQPSDYCSIINYEKFNAVNSSYFHTNAVVYSFCRILLRSIQKNDLSDLHNFLIYVKTDLSAANIHPLFIGSNLAIPMLQLNDFNLLEKTPLELGVGDPFLTSVNEYRVAMRNFIYLFHELNLFHIFDRVESGMVPAELKTTDGLCNFIASQSLQIQREIRSRSGLSLKLERTLNSAIFRHLKRLIDANSELNSLRTRFCSGEALEYYRRVVCSAHAQAIAGLDIVFESEEATKPPQRLSFDESDAYLSYAAKHRDVYEAIIPRFYEIIDYCSKMSCQAQRDLKVLRELPLFVKFGNLERLADQLQFANANSQKIDSVIADQIELFIQEKNGIHLLSQILPYLKGAGASLADPKMHSSFQKLEERFTVFSAALTLLFRPCVETAEKLLPHLLIKSAPPAPPRKNTSRQTALPSEAAIFSLPSDPELSSPSPASSSIDTPPPSFLPQIQSSRDTLRSMRENLCRGRHELTQQALRDGFRHFDDLLCAMRRVYNSSQTESPTARDIHSFVVDCVHHCTLGVEQCLSSLDRDTNAITTQEKLQPRLTHALFLILQNINMGSGDLSPKVRRWIHEISGGEILARDFNLFTERNTALQNLLWANHRLVMGEPGASAEQVFQALSKYLDPLGEFLDSIQDRFKPGKNFKRLEIEDSVVEICNAFCNEMASKPAIPLADDISPLAEMHQHLESFQAIDPTAEISYILGNIRNNLMFNLEHKMRALALLEPINAASHLGSILYTGQNIAERILINALSFKGILFSPEEEAQHDLIAHVDKLGLRRAFTREELDFLARGKASRQLIRYPENHHKSSPAASQKKSRGKGRPSVQPLSRLGTMQEMLRWGRALSDKQSAADDLQGFRSADPLEVKKLGEIKNFALEDIALLSAVVKKVLDFCRK